MIRFYFHPTPNPAKVALFLEEAGLPYETMPVDTSKGEQHLPAFRAINPNGKVPAIVDTAGPSGKEARGIRTPRRSYSLSPRKQASSLVHRKTGPSCCPGCCSSPPGSARFRARPCISNSRHEGLEYAVNRYRREAERHYQVLNDHLAGREFIVGSGYTIADMSAWGWLDRASRVMKGADDPLAPYPHLRRFFQTVDARPAVQRARAVGQDHAFKKVSDEETKRALFPSNYPPAA